VQVGQLEDEEAGVAAAPGAAWPPVADTPAVTVRPSTDGSDGRTGDGRVAWSWPLSEPAGGRDDRAAADSAAAMDPAFSCRPDGHDRAPDMAARMTAEDARAAVTRLVRRARAKGREVTAGDVSRATGRSERQARRLLAAAVAGDHGGRPRVLQDGP
jgi:hypothetical protein